jgi:hypothetical protein
MDKLRLATDALALEGRSSLRSVIGSGDRAGLRAPPLPEAAWLCGPAPRERVE